MTAGRHSSLNEDDASGVPVNGTPLIENASSSNAKGPDVYPFQISNEHSAQNKDDDKQFSRVKKQAVVTTLIALFLVMVAMVPPFMYLSLPEATLGLVAFIVQITGLVAIQRGRVDLLTVILLLDILTTLGRFIQLVFVVIGLSVALQMSDAELCRSRTTVICTTPESVLRLRRSLSVTLAVELLGGCVSILVVVVATVCGHKYLRLLKKRSRPSL